MKNYLQLLEKTLTTGAKTPDRTGTGTYSIFGERLVFDLNNGFPLVTTKEVNTFAMFAELAWMISGATNVKTLQAQGVHIWDAWADKQGNLGPIYGRQWRSCGGEVDQLANVVNSLKFDPAGRRHMVDSWNVQELPFMALPPCHCLYQFYVADGRLSCQVYQRSCDMFLGVPFNIASYAALTHVIAHLIGYPVGKLIWVGGDIHVYQNHVKQVKEQLTREPYPLPHLALDKTIETLDDVQTLSFAVGGYQHHPALKGAVSV